MTEQFQIRMATAADSEVVAWHRARMFQDMGDVPETLFDSFRQRAQSRLRETLASGEYRGWLVSPANAPDEIVAGAGVQLRQTLPRPIRDSRGKIRIGYGRQGLVLNVFTEPAWRRRGLASLLMKTIVAWAREQQLDSIVLHASEEGRPLYERLGFIVTNEMRLADMDPSFSDTDQAPAD